MIDTLTRWLVARGDAAALLLLETLIKATVLVAAAYVSAALLHRASAAVRHRVWSLALVALLLLPVLTAVLPGWCPPFLSSLGQAIGAASWPSPGALFHLPTRAEPSELATRDGVLQKASASASEDALPVDLPPEDAKRDAAGHPQRIERQTVAPVSSPAPSAPWTIAVSWPAAIVVLWSLGLAVSLLHVAVRLFRNRVLLRFSRPVVDSERSRLFVGLCRELNVRRPVRLLESDASPIPMTWGVLRPIVLVPLDWRQWPLERQRIVLLHELAHVKRGDAACHWLGRLACAVYWFHPLVWHSLRRLRIEQEMACDDCVLRAGERPTDYAGHLLELARYCRALAMPAAAAMAQSTGLERRVRALLDQTRSHLPVSRAAGQSVLACGAILLAVVAMVGPASTSEPRPGVALSPVETPPGVTEMLAQQPSASLSSHAAAVWFVGFAPDGKALVSAARDGTIKVWRLPGGALLATLKGADDASKKHELYCAALSSDGKKLATAGKDATITLWDMTTRKKLRTIAGHAGAILSVAFAPDGKTLISGGMDRVLRIWAADTGKAAHDGLRGHSFRIQSVAFSPDGETIVSGGQGNTVKLWQARDKKYLATIPPDGAALALACAANDQGLAVGVDHGFIGIWTRTPQGQLQRRVLEGHLGDVTAVAFAPDGGLLASSGLDGMIKFWDVKTGRRLARLLAHGGGVRSLAFSADGRLLASGGEDQAVKLWDVAKLMQAAPAEPPKPPIQEPPPSLRPARLESPVIARIRMLGGVFLGKGSGASWSPDARRLAFNKPMPQSGIGIVDLETGLQSTLVDAGRDPAWSPKDENVVAYVRDEEGETAIWIAKAAGGQPRRIAEGSSPAWSPDGKTLYFVSGDRTLKALSWPVRGGAPEPKTIARNVGQHPAVSGDEKQVAFFGQSGFLNLIDCPSGKASTIRTIPGRENAFIRWSPDGKQIACGGVTDGVQKYGLWILDSLEAPPMRVMRGAVNRPAWSPDGSRLALDFERADGVEIWMLETTSLAPRKAFHAAHHPQGKPAYFDVRVPFHPKGKVIPLNLTGMQDGIRTLGPLCNPLDVLPDLPRGEKVLAGVKFNIGPRPLQLGSEYLPQAPDKVEGIPVHRPVARLHVLHGSGQGAPYTGFPNRQAIADYRPQPARYSGLDALPDGMVIAYYRVRYEDGSDQWIAVCEGDDVRDWCSWQPVAPTRGTIAWKAYNETTYDRAFGGRRRAEPICIFTGAWQNPHPEKPVATIDYIAAGTPAAPFCVAISVEEPDSQ